MTLWANNTAGETLYYTHDLQKNVTALFGQAVERRAQYEYDPYGNPINTTGDAAALNPYRYSSEYHDEDLGLIYYNYRHYNPQDGRWISRDPIAEQGGVNLYAFVRNRVGWIGDRIGLIAFINCARYDWKKPLTGQSRKSSICVMLEIDTCFFFSCCRKLAKAVEQSTTPMALEKNVVALLKCVNDKYESQVPYTLTSFLVANLGNTDTPTKPEQDPYGTNGPLPEGVYRILPGLPTDTGIYPYDTPGITSLDVTEPGVVNTSRGTSRDNLWIHYNWPESYVETQGCMAFQNGGDMLIKAAMYRSKKCGGTYLTITDMGQASQELIQKFDSKNIELANQHHGVADFSSLLNSSLECSKR